MPSSLRVLLSGVIDYAGLFPPAKLPLDQAIRNYAHYRAEPEGWMLGRFLCPASRLAELAPFLDELFPSGPPLALSALGRSGNSGEQFLAGLRDDLSALAAARQRYGPRAAVEALETRLPATEDGDLGPLVAEAVRLAASLNPPAHLYLEAPPMSAAGVVRALAAAGRAGFKLRCGGADASAFPTPEQVAAVITVCRDARVPLKFTAGLHHPFRHYDYGVRTQMHGFLNVFVAGVLAHARRLSAEQVQAILADETDRHFAFDDRGLRWQALHATTEEIRTARQHAVISFGSCSFEEPRDDLRSFGLVGRV
jgi:hypothetical protein